MLVCKKRSIPTATSGFIRNYSDIQTPKPYDFIVELGAPYLFELGGRYLAGKGDTACSFKLLT